MRPIHLVIPLLALAPPAATIAQEPKATPPLDACLRRNVPEPDNIRAARFVARDRLGAEQVTVLKMYSHRRKDGLRAVLMRFREPDYVRGAAFLMVERDGATEMYFKESEKERAKQITSASRPMELFGTDFTYEDFERLQAFERAAREERLEDDVIGDRPVYVVESRPGEEGSSRYERVVTYIDQETCLALRMELYEGGDRLRKIYTANPYQIAKKGSIWIAHMSMMRDLRDYTTTQLLIDSSEQDVLLSEEMFSVAGLEATGPPEGRSP